MDENKCLDQIIDEEADKIVENVRKQFKEADEKFDERDESIFRIGIRCGIGVVGMSLKDRADVTLVFNKDEDKKEEENTNEA